MDIDNNVAPYQTKNTNTVDLSKFSVEEKTKIKAVADSLLSNKPPKVSVNPETGLIQQAQDPILYMALCYETFGVSDIDLINLLKNQMIAIAGDNPDIQAQRLNAMLAFVHNLKPKSAVEATLAVQMAAAHFLAMSFMARATNSNLPSDLITANIIRANKLMKTFSAHVETLHRLRNTCQQKVVVEHVHVHSGGQAIVGSVSPNTLNRL